MTNTNSARIVVIGVGGGGGNAVSHMVNEDIEGVEFFCLNTDVQALYSSEVEEANQIQIGEIQTSGTGAGADPEQGQLAAEEDAERIEALLKDTDMLFIAAGMGGGTGTGAAPVVARIAQSLGILTVAAVTKPFHFEGNKRRDSAEEGIEKLKEFVDSLIIIPNDKLLKEMPKNTALLTAFAAANNVLSDAIKGVGELITKTGFINVDFADVKTVMKGSGIAMMGRGVGSGSDRAYVAAQKAISSPLLEDVVLSNATGLIVSVHGSMDMSLDELSLIGEEISKVASNNSVRVIGNSFDPSIQDEVHVTVIATGLSNKVVEEKPEASRSLLKTPTSNPSSAQSGMNHNTTAAMPSSKPKLVAPQPLAVPEFLKKSSN